MARQMIGAAVKKQIPFRYVLADIWFSSADNMVFIKETAHKEFVMPLKSNRRVALSANAHKRGRWVWLWSLDFTVPTCYTLYLESVPFPVKVVREVFKNEDGSEGVLLLCCRDLEFRVALLHE